MDRRNAFEPDPTPERPLIYVASLADYNNGRHHGVWIRADAEPAAIRRSIDAMLAASPEPGATDWAIHDSQGFGTTPVGEHDELETIIAWARRGTFSPSGGARHAMREPHRGGQGA